MQQDGNLLDKVDEIIERIWEASAPQSWNTRSDRIIEIKQLIIDLLPEETIAWELLKRKKHNGR